MDSDIEQKSISQIYGTHVGKASDKWASYLAVYEELFQKRRFDVRSVLEIGVQNGGSLEAWAAYFPKATSIVGCDVDERCGALIYSDPRISIVVGDATAAKTREQILLRSPSFDVIIDDGSHKSSDIIRSFSHLFSMLKKGGLYVVEDLHCSYWSSHEGGLDRAFTAMDFFKALADLPNFEHWPVQLSRAEYLADYCDAYGLSFDEADLACIHSVSFKNSVCIVSKEDPLNNSLGKRVVAGRVEEVVTGTLDWNDSELVTAKDRQSTPKLYGKKLVYNREAEDLKLKYQELKKHNRDLTNSWSWRLTKPLRSIEKRIRAIKKK